MTVDGLDVHQSSGWEHGRGPVHRLAWLSPDGVYRYLLSRTWEDRADRDPVWWLTLNPSTADGLVDDPTIGKCLGYARRWGYGGIRVVNLFALRATDPRELRDHPDPVGPWTDRVLESVLGPGRAGPAPVVVCAWGVHGGLHHRGRVVAGMLSGWGTNTVCLGVTGSRHPLHPGRAGHDRGLLPWPPWSVARAWKLPGVGSGGAVRPVAGWPQAPTPPAGPAGGDTAAMAGVEPAGVVVRSPEPPPGTEPGPAP